MLSNWHARLGLTEDARTTDFDLLFVLVLIKLEGCGRIMVISARLVDLATKVALRGIKSYNAQLLNITQPN